MMSTGNLVLDLSFQFALEIINYSEKLEEARKFILAKQLLRSGTSIGANIRESQSCESKLDFIHKMKIASKEAEETEYWLLLCKYANNYPKNDDLLVNVSRLKRILGRIISSAKK